MDIGLAQSRVQSKVENWVQQNDTQRVEVANDIVGHTVTRQHSTKVVGSVTNTVVVPELNWEEHEHSGGLKSTLDILDKLIVPASLDRKAVLELVSGLGRLVPTLLSNAPDTTVLHAAADNTEDVGEIRASRRVHDQLGLEPDQQEGKGKIQDEREQESQPPTNEASAVGCGGGHEGTDVDQKVEPQHDSFSRVLGVLNDLLTTGQSLDDGNVRRHLIQQQRRHVWLEHGSSNSQNVHTNEEGDLGIAVGQEISGTTNNDENVTNTAKQDTPEDHVVATKAGVGEISDIQRQDIGDHVERLRRSVGDRFAETETTLSGLTSGRRGSETVTTLGQSAVDVIGPDDDTTYRISRSVSVRLWLYSVGS